MEGPGRIVARRTYLASGGYVIKLQCQSRTLCAAYAQYMRQIVAYMQAQLEAEQRANEAQVEEEAA